MNFTNQVALAWQFEGTTAPYIGSATATVGGNPTYGAGKYGQAINFPNSVNTGTTPPTNYLTYPVSLDSSVGYSVCFWVNFNVGGIFAQVILSVANSNGSRAVNVFIDQNNKLTSNDGSGNIIHPAPGLVVGTWYHVALAVTTSGRVLYLNGVGTSGGTNVTGTHTAFSLGGDIPANGFSAWCSYDDLRIFKTPLSPAQVRAIYQANGIPGQVASSFYLPSVSGYSYVPISALPSSFTLVQTSTGNAWTTNTSTTQIRDGNWGGDPVLSMTPSQPNDIYSTKNPGIWYRLFGSGNYVRHAGFVMWTQGYGAQSFDFAWAFFLQNGTTNQVKIWNPYPGDGIGNWVQSGTSTAGRVAINTQNPAAAHVYTISSAVSSTSMSGTPLFTQLSPSAASSAVGAFSLRAVNGTSAKAVQVRAQAQFPPAAMTSNGPQNIAGYAFGGSGNYTASESSYSGYQGWRAWAVFDNNVTSFWENAITNTGIKQYSGIGVTGVSNTYNTSTVIGPFSTTISGTAYSGEWIQLGLPSGIVLSSYSMVGRAGFGAYRLPYSWYIGGSNDGSNWSLVDSQTGITQALATQTFTTSSTTAYLYFRMVVTAINSNGNGSQELNIGQWSLYGSNAAWNTDFYADRLGNLWTAPFTGQLLQNWLGTATGYVTTWYDQSGKGNHATQATAANQPIIQRATKGPGYMCVYSGAQGLSFGAYNLLNGANYTTSAVVRRTSSVGYYLCGAGTNGSTDQTFHSGYRNGTTVTLAQYADDQNLTIPAFLTSSTEPVGYNFMMLGTGLSGRMYTYSSGTQYSGTRTFLSYLNQGPNTATFSIGNGFGQFTGEIYELLVFTQSLYDLDGMTSITQIYNNQLGAYGV